MPGTKFVYSDVNFITLGAMVEKVSGEALDVYAEKHIFRAAGDDAHALSAVRKAVRSSEELR